MPIPFTCPHCGLRTEVSDEFAGQSGPCAGCGRTVTVPPPGDAIRYAPPAKRSAAPMVVLVVILLLFGVLLLACVGFFVIVPIRGVPSAREAARRAACSNNLKQIGLAMHNYHEVHGCFPPAYLADENGRPMHSWRVLLLPFLEQGALYEEYDLEEPWDSPQNLALAGRTPQVYRCPSETMATASDTTYVMIVGPETISDGTKATSIAEITDGTFETILVVEAAGTGINWLDPRDLNADEIDYLINDPVDGGIGSEHPGGANVLFCDGAVMFLEGMVDPEQVEAMCTISGGEGVHR
jgi:prepilin-type processing-associated H-X9-DG protein